VIKKLWIALLAVPALLGAQGTNWSESWVGSEWELYARALADRGLISGEPWSIRPFAPPTILGWASSSRDKGPWKSRLSDSLAPPSSFTVLRPSITSSYNSGFAWGMGDGPVWQGRGLNGWATVGFAWHFGILNARIEPLFDLGQNRPFTLAATPAGSSSPFVDDLRPTSIDLPQRFGNSLSHSRPGTVFRATGLPRRNGRLLDGGHFLGTGSATSTVVRLERRRFSSRLCRYRSRHHHADRPLSRAAHLWTLRRIAMGTAERERVAIRRRRRSRLDATVSANRNRRRAILSPTMAKGVQRW